MAIAQDQETTSRRRPTVPMIAAVGVVIFVLVVGRWLTTPFDDWVPVTPHKDLPAEVKVDELLAAAQFRCSAVFESYTATPTDQAAKALTHQDLRREPCAGVHTQRKVLGVVDGAAGFAGLVGIVVVSRRRTTSA